MDDKIRSLSREVHFFRNQLTEFGRDVIPLRQLQNSRLRRDFEKITGTKPQKSDFFKFTSSLRLDFFKNWLLVNSLQPSGRLHEEFLDMPCS